MKLHILEAAIAASALLALSNFAFAQSSADQGKPSDTFTHGESKRCAAMTGADKDQCDKEEATKTQGSAAQEASKLQESGSASTGSSTADTFTHGESKRCASMT